MPIIRYTSGADFDEANAQTSATVLPLGVALVIDAGFGYRYLLENSFIGEPLYKADGTTMLSFSDGMSIDFSDYTTGVTLQGGGRNDILIGGSGDDILIPFGGTIDRLDGGAGRDEVAYRDTFLGFTADLEDPTANTGLAAGNIYTSIEDISGGLRDDRLFALNAGSRLRGSSGDDVLTGRAGDDLLEGEAGADTLIGGGGRDIAGYSTALRGVSASLNAPQFNTDHAFGDTYTDIEGLLGSRFGDRLATGAAGQSLEGGAGDDKLFVYGAPSLVDGGEGRDTLYINRQDALVFSAGSLTGIETIVVRGGAAVDLSAFSDTVAHLKSASGEGMSATITGTAGRDTITLGEGADVIDGGAGNDRFEIAGQIRNMSDYRLHGGDGIDTLELNSGQYFSFTDASLVDIERIVAKGTLPNSPVTVVNLANVTTGVEIFSQGVAGRSNQIIGSGGDDAIRGGDGETIVEGGAGADRIVGGAGDEIILYNSLADMEGDRIYQFEGGDSGDRINLTGAAEELSDGSVSAFAFLGTERFNGIAGAMRAEIGANGVTILQFDADGDRVVDATLYVQSDAPLTIDSFDGAYLFTPDTFAAHDPAILLV